MSVLALSIWSKFVPVRVIVFAVLSYATAVIVEAGLEASMASMSLTPPILSVPVGTVVEVITLP